jgi:hypothetical protein
MLGAVMPTRLLIVVVAGCLAASTAAIPSAQSVPASESDLDAFMSRVLATRDENWKKLQQYTLTEEETLEITALGGQRLYGFEREFMWFPRAGFFIRSPLRADGVDISEAERRGAEDRWQRRAENRERRRGERRGDAPSPAAGQDPAGDGLPGRGIDDIVRQSFEPQFIASANFLRFTFDPGHYALVGRERLLDRDVLKIEYYPTKLFREGRTRPNRRLREDDEKIPDRMNKVSLVALWIDQAERQILQYEFHNVDMDFLPARSLVRLDGMQASMRMGEPFPNVWLPASISVGFQMTLAIGELTARYDVAYRDYRLPTVSGRVR